MKLKEFERWSASQLQRRSGKTQANAEFIREMYIPVMLEHISEHGCSGLKCKSCPLNSLCDRDTGKVKDLAIKVLAMTKVQSAEENLNTNQEG